MRGCLSLPFRLLSLALLLLLAYVAWENRTAIRRWVHRMTAEPPPPADTSAPPAEARRRGQARLDSLQGGRADSVVLTAREIEVLFGGRIRERSGGTIDSVAVELAEGEVSVRARLDGDRLPRGSLGPLAEWVTGKEPIEVRGPLALRRLGLAEWRPSILKVRSLPLPKALWSRLLGLVTDTEDGTIVFPVSPWVTGIRVVPGGAVLYGGRMGQ